MTHLGAITNIEWMAGTGIFLGLVVVVAGVWLIWGGRSGWGARPEGLARWRDRQVAATRLTLGVCVILLGYHAAAWMCPPGWLGFSVPRERWWILVVGVAAAAGGSLLSDWLGRREKRVTEP